MPANTALIAGIGTLLLAMGIGVFIGSQGRSGTSGNAPSAPQTVTVISQGSGAGGATTGTPTTATTTTTPTTTTPAAGAGAGKKATPKAATPAVPKKSTAPVVHVGSPGKGPGYSERQVHRKLLLMAALGDRIRRLAGPRACRRSRLGKGGGGAAGGHGWSAAAGVGVGNRPRAAPAELAARVAELQWDLGGLVYEMATRNHIRVDVLVQRAAVLQEADSELAEVERVIRMEQNGAAGACGACGALHSRGAAYCWQCGQPLIAQVSSQAIAGHSPR